LALAALVAVLAFSVGVNGKQLGSKQGDVQQESESLREDITNPKVKKSFVGKFNKVKKDHEEHSSDQNKKSASRKSLHGKKNRLADELTSSGHKATAPPEDEAIKFMAWLPWILPGVCLTILVVVGCGARMCQAGNYKHTEALREGGVQPSFKYGGPIGRSM